MPTYKKKKLDTFEAERVSDIIAAIEEDKLSSLPAWVGETYANADWYPVGGSLRILSPEGGFAARLDDYLVYHDEKLFLCDLGTFESTYVILDDSVVGS